MEWFGGNIVEAIQRAKANRSVFIVFITGEDEASRSVETTMNDDSIVSLASINTCVAIKLDINSQSGKQFSQIYPVMCVPSVYYINGANGMPLEICGGAISPIDMATKFNHALELQQAQSSPSAAITTENSTQNKPADGATGGTSNSRPGSRAAGSTEKLSEKPPAKNPGSESPQDEKLKEKSSSEEAAAEVGVKAENAEMSTAESEQGSAENLEEKRERAEALLAARREQKMEQEKEKARKEEIERRKLGKEMSQFKDWKSEMERKEIETSMKKEKEEAKRAREKVKAEIERDRRERAERYQTEKDSERSAVEVKKEVKAAAAVEETNRKLAERRENARIQFRLPDGSSVTHMFPSSETLSVARDFIKQNLNTSRPVTLMCTFPKRTFTDDDMSSTLLDLDLAPSAALIVLLSTNKIISREAQSSDGVFAYIMSALLALWLFFTGLFTARPPAQPTNSENSNTGQSSQTIPNNQRRQQSKRESMENKQAVRRRDGNIHRLMNEDDDDDESATWNGNSTQQM